VAHVIVGALVQGTSVVKRGVAAAVVSAVLSLAAIMAVSVGQAAFWEPALIVTDKPLVYPVYMVHLQVEPTLLTMADRTEVGKTVLLHGWHEPLLTVAPQYVLE